MKRFYIVSFLMIAGAALWVHGSSNEPSLKETALSPEQTDARNWEIRNGFRILITMAEMGMVPHSGIGTPSGHGAEYWKIWRGYNYSAREINARYPGELARLLKLDIADRKNTLKSAQAQNNKALEQRIEGKLDVLQDALRRIEQWNEDLEKEKKEPSQKKHLTFWQQFWGH